MLSAIPFLFAERKLGEDCGASGLTSGSAEGGGGSGIGGFEGGESELASGEELALGT